MNREEIIELSKRGFSVEEISDELGCSEELVFNILTAAGEL